MNRHSLACWSVVAGVLWCGAAEAVPQAFVQSDGSDGNVRRGCTVDRPCRTFAAAMTVVDDGGEVVALDAEDFGIVAITKSVAIIGNAGASIVVTSPSGAGVGVTIATPSVNVVLRGLDINGYGVGSSGVSMSAGSSLQVENCVISNFVAHGLVVTTPASVRVVDSLMRGNSNGARIQGGATADVVKSRFLGNRGAGLIVQADTAATTSASVSDSVASSNQSGFQLDSANASGLGRMVVTNSIAAHNSQGFLSSASAGNAVMTVGHSTAAHNSFGFAQFPGISGTSSLETLGNNMVRQNNTATTGLIVPVSPI
jgi:hypothetical protein